MSKEEYRKRIHEISQQRKAAQAKQKELPKGVFFDNDSGTYGFRIAITDSTGKKKDTKRMGFSSAAAARKAREELRYEIKHTEQLPEPEGDKAPDYTKTFTEVYEHYLNTKAKEKALGTLYKQNSMWEHHIKPIFGNRRLSDVTVGEMQDFLSLMYHEGDVLTGYHRYKNLPVSGYSYSYVEGFIKLFWLIYGIANDRGWVDPVRYQKDFVNKSTKLKMPKKGEEDEVDDDYYFADNDVEYEEKDDDENIVIYTREELQKINTIVEGGHLQIPTEIALYCGLRRSEVFGLMKKDIDLTKKIRLYSKVC